MSDSHVASGWTIGPGWNISGEFGGGDSAAYYYYTEKKIRRKPKIDCVESDAAFDLDLEFKKLIVKVYLQEQK